MNFFVLQHARPGSPEDRRWGMRTHNEEGFRTGEAPECPKCKGALASLSWLAPHRVELETFGKEYAEVVDCGNDLIVSDRFVMLYRAAKFKGLESFEPIQIIKVVHRRGKCKQSLPAYWKASVVLSETVIDQQASGFEWDGGPICSACRQGHLIKRWKRLIIDSQTWTGEDIFFARGLSGTIFTSARFKELCEANDITGILLIPAEEYGYDFYPWETQAPSGSRSNSGEPVDVD
jgi:hypothetical protein